MANKIAQAQQYIEGVTVAQMGIEFAREFRDTYPASTIEYMMAVGPVQAFIGLAIKNRHLSRPAPEHKEE